MALMTQFCACCRITVPHARVHVERLTAAQQTEQELSSKRHPIPHLFLCGIYAFHYIFCARARQERFPFPPHARVQSSPARYTPGRGCSTCQRSLAEFAPAGANKVLTIFSGDMCVGENTLRLANVRSKSVRCGEPQPLQTRAQRSGSRLTCLHFSLLAPKGETVGDHGDKLAVRRLALNTADGVAEVLLQGLHIAATSPKPCIPAVFGLLFMKDYSCFA